jgi:4-amino-4-deoxy-L-arabinose transferase-like glycosyltransferase
MNSKAARRSDLWPLALLVIAALLRFSYLSAIEHNVDQAYPIWQALRTLEQGEFPLVGQGTSVLFANPALTGYLYLPFVALTRSPLGAYVLVIALNSLAVPLAYRAVRTLLNRDAALAAAGLMAVNPWVIEYSRSTWVQSLLPFFTCALAWLLWPVLTGRSRRPGRRMLLALIVLTLMTQTYLLAYLMLVTVGLLLLIFWRRVPLRAFTIGGFIFAAAALAYGAGLMAQADGVRQDVNEFTSAPARLSPEAWNHAVRLVSGADYPAARGQAAPVDDGERRQALTQAAHLGVLIGLGAGIALAVNALRTGRRRSQAVILLLWFGLPGLLMSYVGQSVHPFYLLLTLPAGYALVGWSCSMLPAPRLRAGVAGLLIPFAVLMIVNSQRFAQETAATPGAHDLGALPLDYGIQLGQMITAHLPPGGIVYAEVDEWTLNSLAGTTFPLLRDTRAPDFSIVPREGGVYVFAHADLPLDWTGPAYTTIHEQMRLPDGVVLTIDAYPPAAVQQIEPQQVIEMSSEEGLTLLGYDWMRYAAPLPEDTQSLVTYWRVDHVPDDAAPWFFAPFAQLYNAAGEQVTVVEGAAVQGRDWRVGDVHIHRMTLPSEAASVKLGQYDGTRQRNMIFLPDYTPLIDLPLD